MNQQRLLTVLHSNEAPEWFRKSVEREFMQLEYGEQFALAAEKLWAELRNGSDADDGLHEGLTIMVRGQAIPLSEYVAPNT